MNPVLTSTLAVGAFIVSVIALFFSLRKDAHHIRLEVTPLEFDGLALGINNDSACDSDVLSVGYFDSDGKVTWIAQVGDYATNKYVNYPISVRGRSIFPVLLVRGRDVPYETSPHGYCIQLATGRIYALRGNAPLGTALLMQWASLLSCISRGAYTLPSIERVRLPNKKY
ncbi:MAG: hypothetical protein Q8M11_19215 [Sulfuritalea sp.]|nr:hypothetical protein [Sulfuritalea sp.]